MSSECNPMPRPLSACSDSIETMEDAKIAETYHGCHLDPQNHGPAWRTVDYRPIVATSIVRPTPSFAASFRQALSHATSLNNAQLLIGHRLGQQYQRYRYRSGHSFVREYSRCLYQCAADCSALASDNSAISEPRNASQSFGMTPTSVCLYPGLTVMRLPLS